MRPNVVAVDGVIVARKVELQDERELHIRGFELHGSIEAVSSAAATISTTVADISTAPGTGSSTTVSSVGGNITLIGDSMNLSTGLGTKLRRTWQERADETGLDEAFVLELREHGVDRAGARAPPPAAAAGSGRERRPPCACPAP